MKNKKPHLVTFDWDGTLLDTRDCVVTTINTILAKYGKEPWEETKRKHRDNSLSLKGNFPNFFGDDAAQAYQQYLQTYRGNMDLLQRNHGSDALVSLFRHNDIPVGIISNKEQSLLEDERDRFFPDVDFCFTYGDGAAKANKPFPDPILKGIEHCGLSPAGHTIWHIGDTDQDTRAALSANIQAVLIKRNFAGQKEKNCFYYDELPELLRFAKNIFKF